MPSTIIDTIKRGDQRMIAVIMGSGDWSDQTGEEIRHTFGNALVEKDVQRLLLQESS